ncbi:MAG TPA: formyltransferase family protein [Acidimicrobiales bacterium]|jgi:methionyl-tRNA formyltransferase|nr:formyltransferase family protein [Acidimicrobiales bacterium]
MKVLLLTSEAPAQVALANKISVAFDLCGVVVSRNRSRNATSSGRLRRKFQQAALNRTAGYPLVVAWRSMERDLRLRYPSWPACEIERVDNINDQGTLAALARTAPDVVAVSGTNLLSRRTIETVSETARVLNLHTGISPYVKGGPNCTNWCLAKGWFHLIGNTTMWIDPGIDTGSILCTERTELMGRESLEELHRVVMQHAHSMYVRTLTAVAQPGGLALAGVPQPEIGEGPIFYIREWTVDQALRADYNFYRHYRRAFESGSVGRAAEKIRLVSL